MRRQESPAGDSEGSDHAPGGRRRSSSALGGRSESRQSSSSRRSRSSEGSGSRSSSQGSKLSELKEELEDDFTSSSGSTSKLSSVVPCDVDAEERANSKTSGRYASVLSPTNEGRKRLPRRGYSSEEVASSFDGTSVASGSRGQLKGPLRRRCRWWTRHMLKRLGPRCRAVNRTWTFQISMLLALASALFLPDMWVVADISGTLVLDVIVTIVLLMFLTELALQCIGTPRTYIYSFFFWMDILGAASLLLDLSYLGIVSGNEALADNAVVMRAARIAKLGARAGRFTRLVKLLQYIPGMKKMDESKGTANAISGRLVNALSMRVSCLVIILVMCLPIFNVWSYPVEDLSMKAWMDILEKTAERQPGLIGQKLQKIESFYSDLAYYPYTISVKPDSGLNNSAGAFPWASPTRQVPNRPDSTVRFDTSNLICEFNLRGPNQVASMMNILLLIFVMIIMISFSLVLSKSISTIVLKPLESLLDQIRKMAETIFKSVAHMAASTKKDGEEDDDEDEDEEANAPAGFMQETNLLEKVVTKLSVLGEIGANKGAARERQISADPDDDGAAVRQAILSPAEHGGLDEGPEGKRTEAAIEEQKRLMEVQKQLVTEGGLSLDLLNGWSLNPLELDKARIHSAAVYFLGTHNHGLPIQEEKLAAFIEQVEGGYVQTNPYHNWFHAIDVTHAAYRLTGLLYGDAFFSSVERYGLMVSALCHDIGHPGLSNQFLIETSHEFALVYNDQSPLENMHCSKLFELVKQPEYGIFDGLTPTQMMVMRSLCVEVILNTDNALHFKMIKACKLIFEANSEVLEVSRTSYLTNPESFPSMETLVILKQPDTRRQLLKLFLRLADLSNSIKPFRICRIWAWQQLEELFLQGDQEKELALPVQALHDREKTNKAYSQIAFMELLMFPLLIEVNKVMPPSEPFLKQMLKNLKTWQKLWQSETKPPPSIQERQAVADRIKQLEEEHAEMLETPDD